MVEQLVFFPSALLLQLQVLINIYTLPRHTLPELPESFGTSGKALAVVNDEKECLINTIRRNPETKEITNLYISFYAPIEDKILKKIDAMRVGALYSGTILRFLPPTEERKHPYMIVKTDSGVEVLCTLPNWKKPPMEMDSVNVKIVEIRPNGQNTLVLGFIKR